MGALQLTDDIGEKTNLAKDMPEVSASLSKKIQAWLSQKHPTWQPKYPISKKVASSPPTVPMIYYRLPVKVIIIQE